MGQTLTHGIYLPDEGERNCYNGLAANWQLLDGAVGTVAEHTAALAGKAPLVHTHTKADITDFPAYGTTAGTICEGNDSRLSDARTPVAHTHTKSDVTDLLNSNFIPSANNSYDLGSSSYQWNNLYAKNYFYNGTAWGLNKSNTWSNVNTYQREICLNGDRNAYIAPMWSGVASGIAFLSMDAGKQFVFGQRTADANNRFVYDATKGYLVLKTGVIGESNYVEVTPHGSDTRLGDSTNKWKSLNGINPGALSLPNLDSAVSLTTILQAAIDKTQTTNNWTANFTGILCINWITKNLTGPFRCSVYNASDIKNATWGQTFWADNVWYFIVSFPVQNGKTYYFDNTFTRTSEDSAHIVHSANAIYTLGNV